MTIVGLCVAGSPQTIIFISMASSNFLRAVLDISRKATAVKERDDCIAAHKIHVSTTATSFTADVC